MRKTVLTYMKGLVGAAICAAVLGGIVIVRCALAQGDALPNVQAGAEWNDLSAADFHPTQQEAQETYKANVPQEERDKAVTRIARVLAPAAASPDYAKHLLPLKGWQGQNMFFVRRRVGQHWVQATEGAGKITIEVKRPDGGRLGEAGKADAEIVKSLAKTWLSADLQPADFHTVTGQAPRVATWLTVGREKKDDEGIALLACDAFLDGKAARFEFAEYVSNAKQRFAPPYTFGEPAAVNVSTAKETAPAAEDEKIEIKKDLTPEEKKNEAN